MRYLHRGGKLKNVWNMKYKPRGQRTRENKVATEQKWKNIDKSIETEFFEWEQQGNDLLRF